MGKIKHGHSPKDYTKWSGAYRSWMAMKSRCLDPNDISYKYYGAKGVTICKEWINSFQDFYSYVGARPIGQTLGRINNIKGYEPGNVKWETYKEQAHNRSTTHIVEINGVSKSVTEWAEFTGIPRGTLARRLCEGCSIDKWLTPPRRYNGGKNGSRSATKLI